MCTCFTNRGSTGCAGALSLPVVRAAVVSAVREAFSCEEGERKRRLRALQLRWHPGGSVAPPLLSSPLPA